MKNNYCTEVGLGMDSIDMSTKVMLFSYRNRKTGERYNNCQDTLLKYNNLNFQGLQ